MENLKLTNSIAITIPLFLGVLGIVEPISLYLSAYSTMLTGLLQIIVGIIFWIKYKENIHIKIYFILVVTFFILWYYNVNVNYIDALTWPLFFTPLALCIYISIIIYSQKEKL
ncbi:hypothetical protein [Flavobacterium psychraquaticum]|uniref:hypothetical protein n=1 Tax=Flavobacterium psychraquaticum TaxID=3103958 RepID=UPI002ACE88FF|nr:hypothetical protein [Flavobacterium sp. LB-N7T]